MPDETESSAAEMVDFASGKPHIGCCYSNYSNKAGACKVCFLAARCRPDTEKRLQAEAKAAKTAPPVENEDEDEAMSEETTQLSPLELVYKLFAGMVDLGLKVMVKKENERGVMKVYGIEGEEKVRINVLKETGKIRITIDEKNEDFAPLQNEDDLQALVEKIGATLD